MVILEQGAPNIIKKVWSRGKFYKGAWSKKKNPGARGKIKKRAGSTDK